jgi:hypothetical protein
VENDRVEDFSAAHAAPPREGRHAGTDLPIHERLFHHQIVTAWASHHEVGCCRTPTHTSPFEATARSLPHATAAARGSGDALALTDDEPPVDAGTCHRSPELQPGPSTTKRSRRMSSVSIITLLCNRSLACGELSFPGFPAPPGASHEGPSLLDSLPARTVHRPRMIRT